MVLSSRAPRPLAVLSLPVVLLWTPPRPRPARRKSKLDPYKPIVDRLLGEGVWNAHVILREIQAAGYRGVYSNPRYGDFDVANAIELAAMGGTDLKSSSSELPPLPSVNSHVKR